MNYFTRFLLIISLFLIALSGLGQNYIGLHKDEIKVKVKKELEGFVFANEVFNNNKSFVKYENTFEEQTIIFILNSQGYCTSVSRMYNSWLFNRLNDELTLKYGKGKSFKWIEEKEGKKYEIELKRGQWFVTVITRVKK
jgi:hypothetical protein